MLTLKGVSDAWGAFFCMLFICRAHTLTVDHNLPADYHRLRVGGLILAAVLCLIGITILLSKILMTSSQAHIHTHMHNHENLTEVT